MPPRRRRARGHIETLLSGSFRAVVRAVVYAGADPLTNKPRYLRETHKTYAAAEVALTKLQNQVDEERHPRTDITLRHALRLWLEVADLADTTRERYEDLIRLVIRPTMPLTPRASWLPSGVTTDWAPAGRDVGLSVWQSYEDPGRRSMRGD